MDREEAFLRRKCRRARDARRVEYEEFLGVEDLGVPANRSLFLFAPRNPIRVAVAFLCKTWYFSWFVRVTIWRARLVFKPRRPLLFQLLCRLIVSVDKNLFSLGILTMNSQKNIFGVLLITLTSTGFLI